MTDYEVITDKLTQHFVLAGVMPRPSECVVFAQFDGDELIAFQVLQNALFAEGMWAKDHRAQWRTIARMLLSYVEKLTGSTRGLLTMTRPDKQGQKIGRFVRNIGFRDTGWRVWRMQCR